MADKMHIFQHLLKNCCLHGRNNVVVFCLHMYKSTKQNQKNAYSIIFMMDIHNGFYKDRSMVIIGVINDNEQYMW